VRATLSVATRNWPTPCFLLVWVDDEPGQFVPGGAVHAGFKLSASGESIGLFAPDGREVDSVTFAAQASGFSEGSWPDGAGSGGGAYAQSAPTPGGPNDLSPPGPPVIPETTIALAGEGILEFTFGTEFGRYYSIQFSDDLAAWQTIESFIPGTGATFVADSICYRISPHGCKSTFYAFSF